MAAVPYMVNNPEEDNIDEVIVYPACAVTRAKAEVARNDKEKVQLDMEIKMRITHNHWKGKAVKLQDKDTELS